MYWQQPHVSKVYEALTAIADNRIQIISSTHVHCYSSSRNKFYTVEFELKNMAFMSDDNTAYYTNSVSYPMIATLFLTEIVTYDKKLLAPLKNIYWKKINQNFNNDYDMAVHFVLSQLVKKGIDDESLQKEIEIIYADICKKKLQILGQKQLPSDQF